MPRGEPRQRRKPLPEARVSPAKPQRPNAAKSGSGWAKGAAAAAAALLAVVWVISQAAGPRTPPVLRPFGGAPLKELQQFGGSHAERLLWGTLRPGYYLGLRPRLPQSLVVGLMWMDPQMDDPLGNIRHEAQQRDGLARYGWLQHDGERYGMQELLDEQYNISTSWAKRLCEGCGHGGDWGLRVAVQERQPAASGGEGQHRRRLLEQQQRQRQQQDGDEYVDEEDEEDEEPQPQAISLFLYVADESGAALQLDPPALAAALQQPGGTGGDAAAAAAGTTPLLGRWQLHLRRGDAHGGAGSSPSSSAPQVTVNYLGLATPNLHNLTEAVRQGLIASVRRQHAAGQRQYSLTLPDTAQPGGNVAVFQLTTVLPLALDLSFLGGLPGGSSGSGAGQPPAERLAAVSGDGLRRLLAQGAAGFERRFAAAFGPLEEGSGEGGSQRAALPAGTAAVARAAMSNMLGGAGYFYGHSLVRLRQPAPGGGQEERTEKLWDTALYTAVPSRSFFPRGFLWDEGFHQLLVRRWEPALSRDMLAHWFDLINAQGWIGREQILGEEARTRVPAEFVRQSPDAANPPTFFLLLADMSQRVAAAAQSGQWDDTTRADAELLKAAWPRLRAWYGWFNATQAGSVPGAYRWRGRDAATDRELNPKALTSGLDDAPRASHPSDDERHLDLRCWMALASRALATIGANLGLPQKEVRPFQRAAAWLEDFASLNALHLHADSGEYRDWGRHTEDVELQRPVVTLADGRRVPGGGEMRRVVTGAPPIPQLVPQFGYVSLFPLLMRLIPPNAPELGRQLHLLRDESRLWTPYGLRSLSRSASLYQARNTEHDAPYWRGAVWININYLAVQALRHYGSTAAGPLATAAEALHQELRHNLMSNIVRQYQRTGYLWEQYDDSTGEGRGSHPFTGWTGLVALLAADQ